MKLHLCCGSVYLKGYINVDIQGIRRDEYEYQVNETDLEHYYRGPLKPPPLSRRGAFIIDQKVDLLARWPWEDESINEVILIQGIEHFLQDEAEYIVSEIYRVLKSGAKFIFDFPDIVNIVREYADKDFDMMCRLIYCNHKDIYSQHKNCFSEKTFAKLLHDKARGWANIEFKNIVKHAYPVIGGIAVKVGA